MTTLHDLPAELLYSIHLFSLSPSLPYVSRHLRSLFAYASVLHRATYLTLRHERHLLSHAIKYPICTLEVVHALEYIAKRDKGKPLRCSEVPRRLVKGLGRLATAEDLPATAPEAIDLPLITHLLEHYHASPNSKQGYLLARAVFARHRPLIELLLSHGADPALKNGWAVIAAISMGDLDLVRLLMERPEGRQPDHISSSMDDATGNDRENRLHPDRSRKRPSDDSSGGRGKRRRCEERCAPTSEMLEAAVKAEHWQIVEYLRGRGALPNLSVLKLL